MKPIHQLAYPRDKLRSEITSMLQFDQLGRRVGRQALKDSQQIELIVAVEIGRRDLARQGVQRSSVMRQEADEIIAGSRNRDVVGIAGEGKDLG